MSQIVHIRTKNHVLTVRQPLLQHAERTAIGNGLSVELNNNIRKIQELCNPLR